MMLTCCHCCCWFVLLEIIPPVAFHGWCHRSLRYTTVLSMLTAPPLLILAAYTPIISSCELSHFSQGCMAVLPMPMLLHFFLLSLAMATITVCCSLYCTVICVDCWCCLQSCFFSHVVNLQLLSLLDAPPRSVANAGAMPRLLLSPSLSSVTTRCNATSFLLMLTPPSPLLLFHSFHLPVRWLRWPMRLLMPSSLMPPVWLLFLYIFPVVCCARRYCSLLCTAVCWRCLCCCFLPSPHVTVTRHHHRRCSCFRWLLQCCRCPYRHHFSDET